MQKIAAAVVVAAVVLMAMVAPPAALLSLLAALAAVTAPQGFALALFKRVNRGPMYFWSVKFSLTILLLALSLRLLQESALLAAPYFIAGVVIALSVNIALAARLSAAVAPAESKTR